MMKSCLLWLNLFADLLRFLVLSSRSNSSLAAERNQASPDLPSDALDPAVAQPLVQLAQRINRRDAQNLHRLAPQGLPAFLGRKCQAGRPRIPSDLQRLIRKMAGENPSWGDERIVVAETRPARVTAHHPESICQSCRSHLPVSLAAISGGQPFSRITPRPSSPVISAWSRARRFESFTCWWSWNMLHAESFTST